jgi:NADH-quinone oxidoreductase subunit G
VIGSNHTTNEENYLLQKFARQALRTSDIDHHRTGDIPTLLDSLSGRTNALASMDDLYNCKAALVVDSDLAQEHPLIAFQLRANWRHQKAHVYVVAPGKVREESYAASYIRSEFGNEFEALDKLREKLAAEPELVILFGGQIKGDAIRRLVAFGDSLGIPIKYVCLVDYSNSRGASDMGVLPDLLPGYQSVAESGLEPGLNYEQILADPAIDALWVVGSNPLARQGLAASNAFVVVNEMFLTETARRADVVFPASSAYEKNGTVTSVTGEVQKLSRGAKTMGTKSDLEIIQLIAKEMRFDLGASTPEHIFGEISSQVRGYNVSYMLLQTGTPLPTSPVSGRVQFRSEPDLIRPAGNTLFTSGTLGRYSNKLNACLEAPGVLYNDELKEIEVRKGSVLVETDVRDQ